MNRLLCALICFSAVALADSEPSSRKFYTSVDSPFYLGGSLSLPGAGFSLVPSSNGTLGVDTSLNYRPATRLQFGVNAKYKLLSGGLTFHLPLIAGFQSEEGTTTFQDYRINFYGREWGVELNYSNCKGYLIDGVSGTSGEKYYLLPNLVNAGAGLVLYRVLSPERYSMSASFSQGERQLLSAGSFFLVGSFRYQELRPDGQLIPAVKQADFGPDGTLGRISMKTLGLGIGYGLHLVESDFFVSIAAVGEAGPQWVDYSLAAGNQKHLYLGVNGRVKVAVGHNGKTILTGVNVYADAFTEGTKDTLLVNVNYGAQVFFGVRM